MPTSKSVQIHDRATTLALAVTVTHRLELDPRSARDVQQAHQTELLEQMNRVVDGSEGDGRDHGNDAVVDLVDARVGGAFNDGGPRGQPLWRGAEAGRVQMPHKFRRPRPGAASRRHDRPAVKDRRR